MYTPDFTNAVVAQRSQSYAAEAARRRLLAALRCCNPSSLTNAISAIKGRFTKVTAQQCCTA